MLRTSWGKECGEDVSYSPWRNGNGSGGRSPKRSSTIAKRSEFSRASEMSEGLWSARWPRAIVCGCLGGFDKRDALINARRAWRRHWAKT